MDDGGRPERHPDLIPRLRQIAMILVFDLGGPLLAYSLLRSAGRSAVAALVISGVLSAWTLVYGEHEKRKAERLASATAGLGASADAGT